MTTDDFTDLLSPYLDGELDAAGAARLEEHLRSCAACAATLAALRAIIAAAPHYTGRAPAPAVWQGIAARLDTDKVVALRGARRQFGWPALLAASLAMTVVGGGVGWILSHRTNGIAPQAAVSSDATNPSTPQVHNAAVAEERYDAAVLDLERLLAAGRGRLDSATVRTVEESLHRIDIAIAEARAAVQRDPANAYLSRQITANMRRKLNLLRTATNAIAARS